tara:strand:+ start:1531 stop:3231 length:1701 start_codon:yes stop_codon:yes gene_type:complete
MSGIDLPEIKKLLQEKKYSKIIFEIEGSTLEKNRPAYLHNLLGVCRASQKGRTDMDAQYALKDFEAAFYKDSLGPISLDALCSHITLCAELGRRESDLVNNMVTSEKMYLEAEKKFSKNEKFIGYGLDLYKYLLKHKERILKLEEMLSFSDLNKLLGTIYISSQMYLSNWKQNDFEKFQKKFSKIFKIYNANDLSKVNVNKEKIKIGFLSPDFHKSHSITYFIKNLIKDLKQTKFETYGLSLIKIEEQDETTDELKDLFDNWSDLAEKSEQETVNTIQRLKIDVLVDLAGLWSSNKISIFNTRICPLQISWLGFNNSTGMKKVDFILADVNTVKDEEKYYGSKIYKFPKIWNSHCGFKIERYLNELPIKKNGHITFGSLNNFMKVNEEVLDVWINILKNIKNSKIILKSSLYICEDVIRKKFENEGLKDSIQILKKTKRNEFLSHINVYDKIDICLDTFPFNGVTTTIEALWKNVPVLTKAGYNFNSRCGESILKSANLEKFIATSNEDYIKKAVYYANNIDELEKVRKNLYDNIEKSAIFDTTQFTKDFCNGIDKMLTIVNNNYK